MMVNLLVICEGNVESYTNFLPNVKDCKYDHFSRTTNIIVEAEDVKYRWDILKYFKRLHFDLLREKGSVKVGLIKQAV